MSAGVVDDVGGDGSSRFGSIGSMLGRLRPRSAQHESLGDRIFLVCVYVFLAVLTLLVLLPLLYVLASSFSDPLAVTSGRVKIWPVNFTLRGYKVAFEDPQIVRGFLNSVFYTLAGTFISVAFSICLAYPLSRVDLWGRNVITLLLLFTMLFGAGLIPTYMVVQDLHMLDTRWALLLPNAVGVWQVVVARSFFRTSIPAELIEAARIDGCSELRVLMQVVLPISKPIIAVIALMYGIGQWNSYFDALIYLRDTKLYPLQLTLRNILLLNTAGGESLDPDLVLARKQVADLLKFSLIVITTVPALIVYPFVAKHFNKGMLVGAVKG